VLESAARVLGLDSEARGFAEQATATREAFQKAFYRAADQTYATGSQTSLVIPLALGLAPEDARPALAAKLIADIRGRRNHTTAGDIGYRYVLAALTEAGRSDVVFDMANNPAAPSYAAQLAAGATSLTEAWDADPHSSQNHLMLGIGPDPESPGVRHILIAPQPTGDVRWVKASWESVHGPVAVEWRIEGATFFLKVGIPPGMSADVRIPGGQALQVTSGQYEFRHTGFAVQNARP
jgi:alpha-L-rhamnosidase